MLERRPRRLPLTLRGRSLAVLAVLGTGLTIAATAGADLGRFEIDARIYTKHLYQNDDSQGVLMLGNPYPGFVDDISGNNGVATELELAIRGKVSEFVEAGARIASRFGERWHDWWESGNAFYGSDSINTSGESVGMNRASYLKLRGTYVQAALDIPGVTFVRVGASDFSMFNPWTIGKVRYIDRDNGRGYFVGGRFGEEDQVQYQIGAIALPKLYVGPWWSTGVGDPALDNAFWSRDWAYAGTLRWRASDTLQLRLVADFTQDLEIDRADPDAQGSLNANCQDLLGNPIPGCAPDQAVDLLTRYASVNATLDVEADLSDTVRLTGLVGLSGQRMDRALTSNAVRDNQGMSPIVYDDTQDVAGTLRLSANDPFENGFSLQAEYFNIGADWNAIFGARREADVLLTEGFVGNGGQLPTLNLANEFVDFDDDWVESCIGWHGGTGVLGYDRDNTRIKAEYTFIGYNTNRQNRDVDNKYPDFLHGDGFTDTALYNYVNVPDRGRDPRAVFHRDQYRRSHIVGVTGRQLFDVGRELEVEAKLRYIRDEDFRSTKTTQDDYAGDIAIARAQVAVPVVDGVRVGVYGQLDHWVEDNRVTSGNGYSDDVTDRLTIGTRVQVQYHGLKVGYVLEHVNKDLASERYTDLHWNVWRSKATIEAGW